MTGSPRIAALSSPLGAEECRASNVYRNYIAGDWVGSDDAVETRNPPDLSDVVGVYAQAASGQLDRALDAAGTAQAAWAATGLEAHYSALMAIGEELKGRAAGSTRPAGRR